MTNQNAAQRLDVKAFAQAGGSLQGSEPLMRLARVLEASADGGDSSPVHWEAHGELRTDLLGQTQCWLRLQADAEVPQICQRCLGPMQVAVHVDRWFRFVADEAAATEQDEVSEEEVLVLAGEFDLQALIEDEILLELPYIPRHDVCPAQPPMSATDPGFEEPAPRPNPFAALAGLKSSRGKE
jgi:uncharacterized protein